ncbi:transcription elongation factor A protein 2 isoform X2 [Fukomys damarensis]|uniref:transcription elongation factor A protein 2 isoform X2 n=2 Tax=Fukomys damarensis TaxID=885580 RepID=UPI00145528BB|nr:transcription elongation factor A protein 2 isoform X2 [Fukomys damarensis]
MWPVAGSKGGRDPERPMVPPKTWLCALLLALLGFALGWAGPRSCSIPDVLHHYRAVIFEDLQAAMRQVEPEARKTGLGSRPHRFIQKNPIGASGGRGHPEVSCSGQEEHSILLSIKSLGRTLRGAVAGGRRGALEKAVWTVAVRTEAVMRRHCWTLRQEGAMDLLRELKAMPITLHLLQSTRVGMSVNSLRKQSSDEEVIALAKSLIKSWKKLLDVSDAKTRDRGRDTSLPTSSTKNASEVMDPSRKRLDLPRMSSTPRITTFPPVPVTCDAVRNKCREMLTTALQTDHDHVAVSADCERLSAQIEECIFLDVGNTDMKYKNRVRSRISNLKDAKNPVLRRNVLCGAITPQQIAVMTSEEMASDELKEIRKAMTKEAIREHQMARTGGTQTDLFTCGKCRKKNCTYTQVQTRSSDEPMTTFVVCNECGNRWKAHQDEDSYQYLHL